MIEVDSLSVRFGGVTPIDRMTLTFTEGTCGLIGPNGAGKTTFFNVLSGFVKPVGGTVQEVYFRPGEVVNSGQAVIALLPPRNLKVRFFVAEPDRARLQVDQTVKGLRFMRKFGIR